MEVHHGLDLPVGFRAVFQPKPHELIRYLQCKASGEPLPREGVIAEMDLYSSTAEDVFNLFKDGRKTKVVYIFTTRRKRSRKIGKFHRKMSGHPKARWRRVSRTRERVWSSDRTEKVGYQQRFYLDYEVRSAIKYYMVEFTLIDAESTEYVVCRMRKKKSRSGGSGPAVEEDTNWSAVEEDSNRPDVEEDTNRPAVEEDTNQEEGKKEDATN